MRSDTSSCFGVIDVFMSLHSIRQFGDEDVVVW